MHQITIRRKHKCIQISLLHHHILSTGNGESIGRLALAMFNHLFSTTKAKSFFFVRLQASWASKHSVGASILVFSGAKAKGMGIKQTACPLAIATQQKRRLTKTGVVWRLHDQLWYLFVAEWQV